MTEKKIPPFDDDRNACLEYALQVCMLGGYASKNIEYEKTRFDGESLTYHLAVTVKPEELERAKSWLRGRNGEL